MRKSPKILVLGAGLAGLSTAYHLQKMSEPATQSPIHYDLLEQESTVGGLCRSVKQDGFIFDYTGHILHLRNNYSKRLVRQQLLAQNYQIHKRNSWIYSKGVYTLYPFQANTYGLPAEVVKECVLGFLKAKCQTSKREISGSSRHNSRSFYDWIISTFGEGIAKHFMLPYNEKVWTLHPRHLTCDWMHSFVPQPSVEEVITGAFTPQKKSFGYNAVFLYPKAGGIQILADAFLPYIRNLTLKARVTKIDLTNKTVEINNSYWYEYDKLVSTLPVKQLISLITKVPPSVKEAAGKLKCNSVLNVNLGVDRVSISDKHWIYFPEKNFIFYRVGFPINFSQALAPRETSSIYTEVAYNPQTTCQMPQAKYRMPEDKERIIARIKSDLIKAGILKTTDKILTVNVLDIQHAYVIYDKNRNKSLEIINRFLRKNNIYSIGRYGGWKYLTMEETILEGKQTAEMLIGSRGPQQFCVTKLDAGAGK